MAAGVHNFSLPDELEPDLSRIQAYWNGLKRGANDVPFWDDVKFSLRSRLGRESMLIDVFENPLRFRFDLMGADLADWYGETIGNRFLDEIELHAPFDELTVQCRATVERCAPTYYRQTAAGKASCRTSGRLRAPLASAVGQWSHRDAARCRCSRQGGEKKRGLDIRQRTDRGDSATRSAVFACRLRTDCRDPEMRIHAGSELARIASNRRYNHLGSKAVDVLGAAKFCPGIEQRGRTAGNPVAQGRSRDCYCSQDSRPSLPESCRRRRKR